MLGANSARERTAVALSYARLMEPHKYTDESGVHYDEVSPLMTVGETSEVAQVEEFLKQFDGMSDEDRRRAMATVFGIDPAKAVIVRRPNGQLAMQEVSDQSRAQIELMARQGFQAASFTNRKLRRRAEAQARREAKSKPASAR